MKTADAFEIADLCASLNRQPAVVAYPRRMTEPGYRTLADLTADLDSLLDLNGNGPSAVRLLRQAREN